MQNPLQFLELHEPEISAAVGVLTLAAMAWGVVQLALLPLLAAARAGRESDAATAQATEFRLWASLLDRGVRAESDLVEQASVRTLNACALVLTCAALGWLIATLSSRDVLALNVMNFLAFALSITAYNLQAGGYRLPAGWLLIITVAVYWGLNIVFMGRGVGLEYFLGGVLVLPLLIFEREQKWQTIGAIGFLCCVLPAAYGIDALVRYELPPAYAAIIPQYYYGNAVILALLLVAVLYFYNRSADESFKKLEDQKQKSQELIVRVLPDYIARKLAPRDAVVADWHSEASVLFITVRGFEGLYRRVSAVQLLELLSEVFGEFDELIDRYGIEKINTLGTSYVAATGIDPAREVNHAGLARFALDAVAIVDRLSRSVDHDFSISAGFSTGDVVSGVIGRTRPSYDIWGQTVELAYTLRDAMPRGAVVFNEAAHWRLRREFVFEPCPGELSCYRLLGPRDRA